MVMTCREVPSNSVAVTLQIYIMVMTCREVPSNSVAVPKAPVMQLRQLVTVGLTYEVSGAKLNKCFGVIIQYPV